MEGRSKGVLAVATYNIRYVIKVYSFFEHNYQGIIIR